jgi:hypothetical protein
MDSNHDWQNQNLPCYHYTSRRLQGSLCPMAVNKSRLGPKFLKHDQD